MPKRAPEIGVPNTEAKPALMPQITRRRRSSSLMRKTSAKRLVSAAPICAAGPSLPTDPPKARVSTVAASLIGATNQSMRPERWWMAAITASVPWPRASGAKTRISQTQSGNASGSSSQGGAEDGMRARTHESEAASVHRKARVPKPTQSPAAAPSEAHLKVLMRSAACSVYHRPSSARSGGCVSDSSRPTRSSTRCHRLFWLIGME